MKESIAAYETSFIQPMLKMKINNTGPEDLIAFYVYRNGIRVQRRGYENDPVLMFNTGYKPGYYRIKYFIKNEEGCRSHLTHILYLNERVIGMNLPPALLKKEFAGEDFLPCQLNEDYAFNCLFKPYDNKRLFVLLPSALNKADRTKPYFYRSLWMNENIFKGNILCVSDPLMQLYPDMFITWMIGDQKNDYLKSLAKIVTKLAGSLDLDEIIFYGSSSGGFDAIWLAYEVDGSTAIAINPQTCILDYHEMAHVDKFRRNFFNNLSRKEIHSRYADRTDLKEKHSPDSGSRIAIIQNLTDLPHYYYHFLPYFYLLQGGEGPNPVCEGKYFAKNHIAWLYNSPGGHGPETREMCLEALKNLNLD